MIISSKLLSHRTWQKLTFVKILGEKPKCFSAQAQMKVQVEENGNGDAEKQINEIKEMPDASTFANYRFLYPEFLPDPNPLFRNSMREKLERMDMIARRQAIQIPEFYVGSILGVTYSEPHATGKVNRFVGICILRNGCGLRASFTLRNVIGGEPVEVQYNLYDPTIQKIECLRLEKRLDDQLLYLRDAPLEFSTFSFDMKHTITPPGVVPLNETKVTLNPPPWSEKWERKDLKGVTDTIVSKNQQKKAKAAAKPWEKYDLMKIYRETISEEEQVEIFSSIYTQLRHIEVQKSILKRKHMLEKLKQKS